MPNLSGLSLQQSRILLTENGLHQGNVSRMFSTLNTFGQVMAHDPQPGAMVSRGTGVDLFDQPGTKPPCRCHGRPWRLHPGNGHPPSGTRVQLDVGRIRSVHLNDAPLETVVDQTPLAGYRVSIGSRVDLTVNRSPSGPPTTSRVQVNQSELFRFVLGKWFL